MESTGESLENPKVDLKPQSKVAESAPAATQGMIELQRRYNELLEVVSIQKALISELEDLSSQDSLTHLTNRRRFEEAFEQEWRRSMRESSILTLVMIDLDHFKSYNDRFGHVAGDECLKSVSDCLLSQFRRPGDLVARYGGEEFIAFMANTDEHGAGLVLERVRSAIHRLQIQHPESESGVVTASFGYCSVKPSRALGRRGLLEKADEMLYEAKSAGRDRIRGISLVVDAREGPELGRGAGRDSLKNF